MPPSQLKRLKSSLREQGITGPQKSKKQKAAAKGSKNNNDKVQRNAALQQIRDSFNPFELKAPSRPAKFEHASAQRSAKKPSYKDVLHRPGVSKSAGEEMRRATLLPELQRRNKVGGLVDRRIGEGDSGMTAEERAVQRFAQEKSRGRGANVFDLEGSDDDEPKISLTHGGRRLDDLPADDFDKLSGGGDSDQDDDFLLRKRARPVADIEDAAGNDDEEQPQRKKSKKEVMEEVIAKSKFHKYERQKAKEDDDDLRDELDSGLQDMLSLLQGRPPPPKATSAADKPTERAEPTINPERQKLLDGMDRSKVDKDYDARIRQLAQDARAKPSERTKTEEEKVAEEAERLRDLEERRMKRMRGEDVSDDEEAATGDHMNGDDEGDDDIPDQAAEFGFTNANAQSTKARDQLVLEDEDEFALDEDLIASGSELDVSDESASEAESEDDSDVGPNGALDDDEDEFVKDILGDEAGGVPTKDNGSQTTNKTGLAFTYPCPATHKELLAVIKDSPVEQLPTIIQRIRALHHPSLSEGNKEAMAEFASVLVDHLAYMGAHRQSLAVIEQVIRHLHSLSRSYTEKIAASFRQHMEAMREQNDLNGGDLVLLTAIGSIYPTSDHFHQVVTPAMTLIARWLGLNSPDTPSKSAKGSFLVALCIKYQALSKRYIPEVLRFTYRALSVKPASKTKADKSQNPHLTNLLSLAELWRTQSSFPELFESFLPLISPNTTTARTLKILLTASIQNRRPLEMHHHRPLAIRTSIPKFEEGYHPDKHYDPDRERAESTRLRKEFKRERKGAMRELRKDANFLARETLKEKRARDAEYERKYRRLVAEVQGEEAQAGKEYEREKRDRKRRRQD